MTKRKDRAGYPGKEGWKGEGETMGTESDVYGRSRKKRAEKKGCSRKVEENSSVSEERQRSATRE